MKNHNPKYGNRTSKVDAETNLTDEQVAANTQDILQQAGKEFQEVLDRYHLAPALFAHCELGGAVVPLQAIMLPGWTPILQFAFLPEPELEPELEVVPEE